MYKKPAPKKSGTSKKTTKRKTSKTRKSKVFIPASKVIGLCGAIIVICMSLLLVTTVKTHDIDEPAPVSQRFEQADEKPSDLNNSKKSMPEKQTDLAKTETSQQKKQTDSAKPQNGQQKKQTDSTKPQNGQQKKQTDSAKPQTGRTTTPTETKSSEYNFPKAVNGAQLIFVFDDAGQNNAHLEKYMALPFPITVAVLPQLPSSVAAADRVRRSGNEVILHQPMQSISDKVNPGPGAITPDMDEAQIITQLFLNINEIGPVAGMNNHEGSAITADAEKMAIILQTASENGIYFLDSRTNVETKVPYVAGELGYSYYERNIFLDNEKTEAFALKELRRGLDIANKNGNVIMIGHIWSADFLPAFLNKVYPELKAAGYTFSTVGNSRAQK